MNECLNYYDNIRLINTLYCFQILDLSAVLLTLANLYFDACFILHSVAAVLQSYAQKYRVCGLSVLKMSREESILLLMFTGNKVWWNDSAGRLRTSGGPISCCQCSSARN